MEQISGREYARRGRLARNVARWGFAFVRISLDLEVDLAAGVPHPGIAARTFIIFLRCLTYFRREIDVYLGYGAKGTKENRSLSTFAFAMSPCGTDGRSFNVVGPSSYLGTAPKKALDGVKRGITIRER